MNAPAVRPKRVRNAIVVLVSFAVALSGSFIGGTAAFAAPTPSVSVSEAPTGGGQVTVSGSGFTPEEPGIYVGLGAAGSTGFYSASPIDTVVVAIADEDGGLADGGAELNADGTFTVTLTVPAPTDAVPAYAVYTSKAHGQGLRDQSQDTVTAVAYAPAPVAPTISVSKTTGLDRAGETITVTGSGFLPDPPATSGARPPLAGKFGGAYVVFGKFADAWKPSEGVTRGRVVADQKWVVNAEDLGRIGGEAAGGAVLAPDGTFSVQLHVEKGFDKEPETGNYGIYTYSGSGAAYAPFETFTPLTFATQATGLTFTTTPSSRVTEGGKVTLRAKLDTPVPGKVAFTSAGKKLGTVAADATGAASLVVPSPAVGSHTLKATFTPTDGATYAASAATRTFTVVAKPVIAAGSLTWGFKQAFRSYVTGPIAHGTITTTGAGTAGGAFVFGQAAGSTFNGSTGISVYSGSVRFTGHAGVLDLRLSNPVVRIDSPTSATLMLSVNGGGQVSFASLALASGSKSVSGGAMIYSGVPATLTAQGAAAFVHGGSQFYPAGTALDSVSFVIGSQSSGGGGSTVVAAFTAPDRAVPATPPATTGITLETPAEELVEGGEVTITADGFEPNESGIKVVIYSDPVILATDVTADSDGVVTWTGNLPPGLTGDHTLTLQGSVDRGIQLTIAAPMTMAMAGCAVTDATLTWGFKEAFRSYLSSAIANGEWTVAESATYETPNFGWSQGAGHYDPASGEGLISFPGSVQFTGHGGILNTTIANPQVRFDGDGHATLLLDVSGTTRDGEAVDQVGVEFATVDLTAADGSPAGGEYEFAAAPAVLTDAGSAAFGTYEPGAELDPITVAFSTPSGCAQAPTPAETEGAAPEAETDAGPGWLLWVTIAVVLFAAAVTWIVIARRRAA